MMNNRIDGKPANQQQAHSRSTATSPSDSSSSSDSFQIAAPSISLPKGGGAIRGMGEKFAANPVTGTGSMTIPIAVSPGRSGFGPQLSLSYDSGAGNGPFGFGWNLSLPSITRKTDKGLPRYHDADESDVFILSGAEDLVPLLVNSGGKWEREELNPRTVGGHTYHIQRYRPRIEGLFARIERWSNQSDPTDVFWRSISKDNLTTWYGKTSESRIQDPADPSRVFSWLICESYDDKGNVISYAYKAEDSVEIDPAQAHERNRTGVARSANRYLKRVTYGNRAPYMPLLSPSDPPTAPSSEWLFEVVFDYGEHDLDDPRPTASSSWSRRNDPFSSYRAGFEVRTYRLCQRVLMFHHFPGEDNVGQGCLVRSTDFTYEYETDPADARVPIYAFLTSVAQSSYVRQGEQYRKKSLPPVEFTYSKPEVQDLVEEVDADSVEHLPIGVDGSAYQWTDLHGEGIPGILTEQGGAWFYKRNVSPMANGPVELAPLERVAIKPNWFMAGGAQFMDLAGDGQPDLVTFEGSTPGLYEHDEAEGWEPFRPFTARLNRDTRDPNLKFVDVDGDGHADVLITEEGAFVWHPSLAEEGFGPANRVTQAWDEEKGPRLVFADAAHSIYLADLSGDGLADLVRIRNGEVCYWPNLGYGRFGAKVTMDHAPWFDQPECFEQQRVRLADIDGSGTTDIIYLHRDGVRLYFNQSGNSWSQPQRLNLFPRIDDVASIVLTDLLGNGTACLVWSSALPGDVRRPMRYVNLMGSQKPHLLVKTINNLGAETRITYAPSTKFYLQDKRDGQPWITKLPFPVHVVERVETYDHIGKNRFVTRSSYHHGYFDGEEREFRGFGRVDQFDTEEFAALTGDGTLPPASNIEAASHVPPVLTKTWFHTGAVLHRDRISRHFEEEYYREPNVTDEQVQAQLLPDTVLPSGLTVEEEREACRALKGSMLRQEVYALDATEKEPHPYTVTEQNLTVRLEQPRGSNRHAVFFTHPREALSYHYERIPTDPRVQHAVTLQVDQFGNVLKSVAVGYGRRQADPALEPRDQQLQAKIFVTSTENSMTNVVDQPDSYRTPLPSQTRTYELLKVTPDSNQSNVTNRFHFDELVTKVEQAGDGQHELPYEDVAAAGATANHPYRRVIEEVRVLYRPNDLGAAQNDPLALLPLGTVESLALPGESYKRSFTPGLLNHVFQRNGQALLSNPAEVLAGGGGDRGGYVDLDADQQWWVRSGRAFLSPTSNDTAAQELAHARQHFFLPHRYRDPFHTSAANTESVVIFDAYDLLVTESRDALQNVVRAENDYRVLGPRQMTDPNGNRSAVSFDILGMVAGTAVMGKATETLGDLLEASFQTDLTQAQIDAFMAEPRQPSDSPDESQASPIVYELLGAATSRIVYDIDRFMRVGEPPVAASIVRETHVSDLQSGQRTKIQVSFSYSDGFGREIQKKVQAEPGPVPQRGADGKILVGPDGQPVMTSNSVSPRWVGSGWTIFNNKGKPVRQYEPFFTDRHSHEFSVRIGVSPVLFYDPAERVVATVHPNYTWEKVVFDPWRQESWDVNDTALVADPGTDPDVGGFLRRLSQAEYLPTWHALRTDSAHAALFAARYPDATARANETAATKKTEVHAATPSVTYADSLGRSFLTVAHNRFVRNGTTINEHYATRVVFDIEGNQREVIDAKDRIVMRYDYDMLGTRIHQASMEAGERWMVNDVSGKPMRAWDSRGHTFATSYDLLRRPTETRLREGNAAAILIGRTLYGEGQPTPEVKNQRGKVVRGFDQAGVVTTEDYDFKGNLLRGQRQLATNYKTALDWSTNVALEPETFTSSTTYDALNRPVTATSPDGSIYWPTFNEANLLEKVDVHLRGATVATPFVLDIDYDAKGQRELIRYGNGTETRYAYDPLTYRLTKLTTVRVSDNARLQDLSYAYDPAGNITTIRDDAQQTLYFNNQVVEPHNDYSYDAIYRLIEATGREHIGQAAKPQTTWSDEGRVKLAHPQDGQAMRTYQERYQYDPVGNFEQLVHTAANGNWTRSYTYDEPSLIEQSKQSNRLSSTTVGSATPETESFNYDAHGNMLHMAHLPSMRWDFKDELQQVDLGGGGTAYYVYDASGQRVRKVIERQNGIRQKERIYLGGFEIYRESGPSTGSGQVISLERETLHIMDNKQRIALVETKTIDVASPLTPHPSLVRYQFGNHLGAASLELDDTGQLISYEEYHPYGTTSFQAVQGGLEVGAKRYRYTGMERDEETGLSYHGARFYAPWMGCWTAVDPAGLVDGPNVYRYSRDSPVTLSDPGGLDPTDCSGGESCGPGDNSTFESMLAEESRIQDEAAKMASIKERIAADERLIAQLVAEEDQIINEGKVPFTPGITQEEARQQARQFIRARQDEASKRQEASRSVPPPPPDPRKHMYEVMASNGIAAVWIGMLLSTEATLGRAFGFEVNPERAAASGSFVSLSVTAIGSINTPPPMGVSSSYRPSMTGGKNEASLAGAVGSDPSYASEQLPLLPQHGTRNKPTFDWKLTPKDDSGMGHLDFRHAPWSTAKKSSKFTTDSWPRLKAMVNEAVEKGTVGTLKEDKETGRPQAGAVYEYKYVAPIGVDAKGKQLFRLRVVVDANNHVTTAFPF